MSWSCMYDPKPLATCQLALVGFECMKFVITIESDGSPLQMPIALSMLFLSALSVITAAASSHTA